MKRIDTRYMGVDQGETALFSDFEDGGEMWTGKGPRMRRHSVRFSEGFRSPPAVHCSLSMWDIDSATHTRVAVSTEDVTEAGFDVVFRTWGDTRIARARACWMAIGEVSHEDDWELD